MSDKIFSKIIYRPRRVLTQTAKTRGGTLEVPSYRQDYFRPRRKNLDFREHGAQRIAKKFAGGQINSPRSSKSRRNGGDYDIEQFENHFKDLKDGFGIKITQKVS